MNEEIRDEVEKIKKRVENLERELLKGALG
jgi:hypothetical protein